MNTRTAGRQAQKSGEVHEVSQVEDSVGGEREHERDFRPKRRPAGPPVASREVPLDYRTVLACTFKRQER